MPARPDIIPFPTRDSLSPESLRKDPHAYLRSLTLVLREANHELDHGLETGNTELVLASCRRIHSIGVLAYSAGKSIVGERP